MNPLLASQLVFALDEACVGLSNIKEVVRNESVLIEQDPNYAFTASWNLSRTFIKVNELVSKLEKGLEGQYVFTIPTLNTATPASLIAGFLVYLDEIETTVLQAKESLRLDTIANLEQEVLVTDETIYGWLDNISEQ